MANISNLKERKAFYFKLKLSILIIFIWVLIEFLDNLLHLGLEKYGVYPKTINGLLGIFTFPFLHGDWNHLFSNASSAVVLFTALFVLHEKRSLFIFFTLYFFSGLILWCIGEKGSNHIGASAWIYAVAFYLFISSIIVRDKNALALSFFIILFYGSMVWGIMPYFVKDNVSWEGHLSGAIIGIILACYEFRNYKPPKSKLVEEERPFFEKYPLE